MNTLQSDSTPEPSHPSDAGAVSFAIVKQGYPRSIIANGKVDDKFCCSYCKLILRKPMQGSCGHRFCQDCLLAMQDLPQPVYCQSCKEEGYSDEESVMEFQGMFEDKAARREMRKLQVKCNYQGCTWKGLFHDFIEHEEKCEKKKVPCTLCGASVSKSKLANHESKTCPKRIVKCAFCKEDIVFESKEKHTEECPKYLIKCEKCQTSVERQKLRSHEESECVNRAVKCPYPDCNVKLTMDKYLAHICRDENLAKHIHFLLHEVEKTGHNLTALEQKLARLTQASSSFSATASSGEQSHPEASACVSPPDAPSKPEVVERTQGDGAQSDFIHEDRQKLKLHEDLMSVLHSEILRCITKGEALGRGMEKSETRLMDCYAKIEDLLTRVVRLEKKFTELSQRPLDDQESGQLVSEGSGLFTWIIKGYGQVRRNAVQGEKKMICSPIFLSSPGGYSMRLKLYPNGDGTHKGRNVSLYVQIVRGSNDDLLLWPYNPTLHFMLVDQVDFKQHYIKVVRFDPQEIAARRPLEEASIATGHPAFIPVEEMNTKMPMYWPKDVLYLKFHLDTPKDHLDRLSALNPLTHIASSRASVKS